MRRNRGLSIGSMLVSIIKSQEEFKAGAIHTLPNHWIFSDAGTTNANGYHLKPYVNKETGRLMSLVAKRGVSNCPGTPMAGDFPKMDNGSYSVPNRVCLKCPHHVNSVRPRGHFCAELKRIRAEAPSGLQTASEAWSTATKLTKGIIG